MENLDKIHDDFSNGKFKERKGEIVSFENGKAEKETREKIENLKSKIIQETLLEYQDKYGEEAESKMEEFLRVMESAQSLYDSGKAPYHNFLHALESLERGNEIILRCEEGGVNVNKEVARYAILFHDAGFHKYHDRVNINEKWRIRFKSKERYSSYLASKELKNNGLPRETIEEVKKCIMGTHKDAQAKSVEERIVKASDLIAGFSEDYQTFKENSEKIRKEQSLLFKNEIPDDIWRKGAKENSNPHLEMFLNKGDELMDYYTEEGGSHFYEKTQENLEAYSNL